MRIGLYSYAIFDLLSGSGERGTGGAELQLATLGRMLRDRGQEVVWLVGDGFSETSRETGGWRFVKLFDGRYRDPLKRLWYFWRALRQAAPDVIVERGSSRTTFWFALFCRLTGRRFVFLGASDVNFVRQAADPNFNSSLSHHLYTLGLRMTWAIGVQKESQRKLLLQEFGLEGVIVRNFPPEMYRSEDGPAEPCDVLWVSNVIPYKQPEVLLRLARRMPNVSFSMIGGARDLGYFERIRSEALTIPNLRFHGFVPSAFVARHMSGAKILVNTTKVSGMYEEGFPNTFLQAWSSGVPVVSLLSNPDSVITAHRLGDCVQSEDELADAIARLLRDAGERESMGRRGIAYVHTHHDPETIFEAYDELLGLSEHDRLRNSATF